MATDPLPADVTLLTVADRLATRGDNAGPAIAGHLEVVRTVLPHALAHQRDPAGEPLVRGDDLAAELGIRRGPRLGELLAEIAAKARLRRVCHAGGRGPTRARLTGAERAGARPGALGQCSP
jgi:hypothetical protein